MTTVLVGDGADAVPTLSIALADPDATEIVLSPGSYVEHVRVSPRRLPLTIRSATGRADDVVITFGLCQGDRDRTGMELAQDCATLTIDADDVTLHGLTIENSFDRRLAPDRVNTQALALRTRGTRVRVEECVLRGRQDTLLLDTPSYASVSHVHVRGCLIEGDVDFIYGRATALIEDCEIRSVGPGYVTAPSTARENPRGFLLRRCRLTADADVPAGSVSLGRPWHPGGKPDAVGQAWFLDCELGTHIAAERWADMGGFAWRDARFAEHPGPVPLVAEHADPTPLIDGWLAGWDGWRQWRRGEVVVVGDSTASEYPAERAPREGWGQRLGELIDRPVRNCARSGASARSFIDLGLLDAVLDTLAPGDVLLVQFGHNDGKPDERYSDVFTGYSAQLRRYLVGARARGAQPVLLTSVERRLFDEAGRARATHGGYPQQVRDLARAEGVPLVDVTSATRELWQQQGPEGSRDSFLHLAPGQWPGYPDGERDDTHLSTSGARAVARTVADGLVAAGVLAPEEVAPHFMPVVAMPLIR